ncbi:LytTR family DNA-binding domain-containing protein [Agriterribacter sp.]|uniref:LytR/AlgR family response regulator transcription factor n=1 Tax=Agriterribacter sp. TaxID=2821509 RepID=UPI002D1944B5|nr:LytTR family DNA-binding domain-containing protein [Agriterribacter sp.]HRO47678.1 LytTR family DNA-binding domain-containing protein [Agriterribacter sp.]HRQ17659.1 LytTR family DNA-binding domain-containing protein [Agriterribacter sp.]
MNNSNYISFVQDKKLIQLHNNEILHIRSAGDYIRIITPERKYITHSTMKNFAAMVNPNAFVRVHRCFIVNIRKAAIIEDEAVQIGGTLIPISKTYKAGLLQWMAG